MRNSKSGAHIRKVPREVQDALDRFRGRVRGVRALRGLGVTLALGSVLFGSALVLDRYFLLSPEARFTVTTLTLGVVAAALLMFIIIPLFKPIPDRRAARGLESAAPSLEESLISTLELVEEGAASGASPQLVDVVARSTAGRLADLEVRRLVDPRPAHTRLLVALAALLGLFACAAWDFRAFSLLAGRFFHPGMDLPRPSRVALHVLPGNAVIGIDDDFIVHATLVRGAPDKIQLRFRVPGGEWRTVDMEPEAESHSDHLAGSDAGGANGARGGQTVEFHHEFRRARHTFEYQALAGDFLSPIHRVEVRERPRPELFTMTYRFPSYTRHRPLVVRSPRGDLSAVAGTMTDLEVSLSGHPVVARLTERGSKEAVDLPIESNSDVTRTHTRIEIQRDRTYQLYLEDADGVSNRGGESYSIHAEDDRPPLVRILSPKNREVVVEEASRLELQFQAQDDFGIEDLEVVLVDGTIGSVPAPEASGTNSSGERQFPIALDLEKRGRRLIAGTYLWDLAILRLRPGESRTFHIAARDGLGQSGASQEMVLRMAFLPDPPEGAEWLTGLWEIQTGLDRARSGWVNLLNPGSADRADFFAADPARVDQLSRLSEKLLKELARLRRLGELSTSLGCSIPIPTVNRRALVRLGRTFKRFGEEEGNLLWMEILVTVGKMREALREKDGGGAKEPPPMQVSTGPMYAAYDQGSERLQEISTRFTAIHLAERIEGALERLRALRLAEEEMVARLRDLAVSKDSTPLISDSWAGAASLQKGLQGEAMSLGAELDRISKLGAGGNGERSSLARVYLDRVIPAMDEAKRFVEDQRHSLVVGSLEAAAKALRDAEATLIGVHESAAEEAKNSRAALISPTRISSRLLLLSEAEAAAAEVLEDRGLEAMEEVTKGDRDRRRELVLLQSDFEAEAEAVEKAQPVDYESAGDIATLRDIYRHVAENVLLNAAKRAEEIRLLRLHPERPNQPTSGDLKPVIADRRRAAEILGGLSRAYAGMEQGMRLGLEARELDAVAEAEESVAWQLRATSPDHARALRMRARVEREMEILVEEIRLVLEKLGKSLPGDSSSGKSLAGALGCLPSIEEAAREAGEACLTGDPKRGITASLEAARKAGEAARYVDDARAALPGLAMARAWTRRQIGSFPERVERLAQDQRAHAATLEKLCDDLGGLVAPGRQNGKSEKADPLAPHQPERLAAMGVDQELLREEALRLSSQAAREAGRLASLPVKDPDGTVRSLAMPIRQLDLAAGRILDVSRDEMLRALKAIEEASRSTNAAEQQDLLSLAFREETRAADIFAEVARILRLLDERETVEITQEELEKLLLQPPALATDPASVKRALEEARALLDGVIKAAGILSARLPEGVLKAELLECLNEAAEKFREALEAGKADDGARVVGLLGEGRALLAEAIALARRIRGDTDAVLSKMEKSSKGGAEKKPMSRELRQVYEELQKIQALREWQGRIEAELEELLRDPTRPGVAEKMEEIRRLQEALAQELGARFMTTAELLEIVADLLSTGKEAKRIGEAELQMRSDVSAAGKDLAGKLQERQESLISSAETMQDKFEHTGTILTINLPAVLIPFWEAADHLDPALKAMRGALKAIPELQKEEAGEEFQKAAVELNLLAELLEIARQRALEEIADREEEFHSIDFGSKGMEAAMESLQRASQDLAGGRGESALLMQQSAMRSLQSAAESMRARLYSMRMEPGQEGLFLTRILGEGAKIPGLSWEVLVRGDLEEVVEEGKDEGKADDVSAEASDAFPVEYRELVRIYLRALAGLR